MKLFADDVDDEHDDDDVGDEHDGDEHDVDDCNNLSSIKYLNFFDGEHDGDDERDVASVVHF